MSSEFLDLVRELAGLQDANPEHLRGRITLLIQLKKFEDPCLRAINGSKMHLNSKFASEYKLSSINKNQEQRKSLNTHP